MNHPIDLTPPKKWEIVKQIFNPYGGWSTGLPVVADLIEARIITYTSSVCMMGCTNHYTLIDKACQLLRDLGEENPLKEYKRWDVYSPKLKIRIECGHTDTSRLLWSLSKNNNEIDEFWILQYPKKYTNENILYKFKQDEKCQKIISSIFQRGSHQIGKILLEESKKK